MRNIPTIEEFFKKLASDETLAKKYGELVKAKDSEGINKLMKENGVTEEDMKTVAENLNTIDRFNLKLYEDKELAKEYQELVERKDNDSIVSFMKKHGVTDEDLNKAKQKIEEMAENGELSDKMLEEVAGGGKYGATIGAGVGFFGGIITGAIAGAVGGAGIGLIAGGIGAGPGAIAGGISGAIAGAFGGPLVGIIPGDLVEKKITGS